MIWCKGFPFWYLVTGVRRIRVEVIWLKDRIWRRQAQIWWPDTQYREGERERDVLCWNADWILMEEIQLSNMENYFG